MKKSCTRLLALLCALLLLLPATPAAYAAEAETANRLTDGSFESTSIWDDNVWTLAPEGGDWTDVTIKNDNEDATTYYQDGARSLNVYSLNENVLVAKQTVELEAGKYVLSGYFMGDGTAVPVLFAGSDTSADITLTGFSNWIKGTLEFTVSKTSSVTVGAKFTCSAKGWGYVDNMTLTEVEEESTEPQEITLVNGDFEKGDATNWTLSGFNQVKKDGDGAVNQTYALNLWLNGSADIEASASYTVHLDPGDYYFTFEISGAEGDSGLNYAVTANGSKLVESAETCKTAEWNNWDTVNTGTFKVESASDVTFTLSGTVPAGYWGYLDNLKLFKGTTPVGPGPETKPDPVEANIYVPYVTNDENFIRGADVSSLLSILNSGAHYYDKDGTMLGTDGDVDSQGQAFMKLLAASGVNWIRLRVWNNPFNAQKQGYGGGNNDIEAAVTMGKWATKAGMKVLIDFHYSDFWADPGKQQVPKAWEGYSIGDKVDAVTNFTTESLNKLIGAGVNVGMVQVGNETTNQICGEKDWPNMAQIFNAGSKAVRAVAKDKGKDILVAVHFTNPETAGKYTTLAKNLNDNNVDYDVFASSYYPYWHGTIENLTSVLKTVATTYTKKVMVAETSWAWTLEDGDGHGNTVSKTENSTGMPYPFSVQGQATEFAAVAQAVKNVGEAGLGLFYWENAWIPVGSTRAQNLPLWEKYGSGWASSYSKEYDPDDAGVWYGGSAVDNQAMFDFTGKALESLNVFKYIQTGTTGYENEIVSVENPTEEIEFGGNYTIPNTVTVTYTNTTTESLTVTWDEADRGKIDVNTPGTYTVRGTVTKDGKSASVTYTLTVKLPNLLQNPSFEESDVSMYTVSSNWAGERRTNREDNAHSGSYYFHFYSDNAITNYTIEQKVTLEPGVYSFSLYAQGEDKGTSATFIYVKYDGIQQDKTDFNLTAWHDWQHPTLTFTITEKTDVTVGVSFTAGAQAWGTVDDWALNKTGEYVPPCTHPEESVDHVDAKDATMRSEGNIEYWYCQICEKYFKAEPLTADNEITQAETVIAKLTADQCKHPADVLEHVTAKAATYDAEGNIEYWHCQDCDKYFKAESLAADDEITQDETVIDKLTRPSGGGTGGTGGTTSSVTTSGDETTAAPSANSSGSVTVPESMGKELVDKTVSSGSGTAVVAPKFTAGSDTAQVTLPGSALTGLAEKTDADLRVDTPAADVTIPNEALSELGKGGQVTVATEGSDDTVTVTVSVDGKSVDQVTGGLKAALALKDGEVAVLVNDDGTETILPKSLVEDGVTYVVLDGSATVKVIDNSKTFDDVGGSSWFADAVDFASSHALFNGVTSTTFAPDTDMSRAMLATVLWRLESEAEASEPVEFPDVPDGQWYTDAIAWASENGIVLGYDDGSFNTNGSATRQELVVMVYRYAKLAGIDTAGSTSLDTFTDGSAIADWAESAMKWAVSNGIIQGHGGRLDPTGTASRAEVATILQRLVGLLVGK